MLPSIWRLLVNHLPLVFLDNPAGYDINQKLIEYSSQSTHFRAAVVGLLNTLLVAVMGCLLATFLGVTIGILRLSNNWVVSRLAAVLRGNVPQCACLVVDRVDFGCDLTPIANAKGFPR